MLKLVRLNSKTFTIKRLCRGHLSILDDFKKWLLVDVNRRQLCDLEPIICSFLRLGKGSMGITLFLPAHHLDKLLYHTDCVTPSCVKTTFSFKKTHGGKMNFTCGIFPQQTLNAFDDPNTHHVYVIVSGTNPLTSLHVCCLFQFLSSRHNTFPSVAPPNDLEALFSATA